MRAKRGKTRETKMRLKLLSPGEINAVKRQGYDEASAAQ